MDAPKQSSPVGPARPRLNRLALALALVLGPAFGTALLLGLVAVAAAVGLFLAFALPACDLTGDEQADSDTDRQRHERDDEVRPDRPHVLTPFPTRAGSSCQNRGRDATGRAG